MDMGEPKLGKEVKESPREVLAEGTVGQLVKVQH